MLTKLMVVSGFILGSAGLALASTAESFVAIDQNADALIALDEFQAAYPEIDTQVFAQLDANADEMLSPSEYIGSNLPEVAPSDG